MSKFVRNIVVKTNFDGDAVTLTLSPLTLGEVMIAGKAAREMQANPDSLDSGKLLETMLPMITRHLVKLEGLVAADNSAVTTDEFLGSSYFTRVIVEAGKELLASAYPQNPSLSAP